MNWQRRRTHLHGSVLQYGLRSSHQEDRQEWRRGEGIPHRLQSLLRSRCGKHDDPGFHAFDFQPHIPDHLYLNGELPTLTVRASLTSFFEHLSVAFPDPWKMKRDLRDGLLLPQEVLMCAIKRCGEFAEGEYGSVCPWVQKEILIPSCFKKLMCEHKIILLLPVRLGVPRLARSSIHDDV